MIEQAGSFQCFHCCSIQWQYTGVQRVPLTDCLWDALNWDVFSPGGVDISCNYGPALAALTGNRAVQDN